MTAYSLLFTLLSLSILLFSPPGLAMKEDITPSTVYTQILQIEKEIDLLKQHYKITTVNPVKPVTAVLLPRHVWQKSYVILVKINIFRRKHGLSGFTPVAQEPSLNIHTYSNWGQMQRILTEIRIAKRLLGINTKITPIQPVHGKQPIDAFNKLNQISYNMDTLNSKAITLSYTYAEVLRMNEDINAIMRKINSIDNAVPPPRQPKATPEDALAATFILMNVIQQIQKKLRFTPTDFSVFHTASNGRYVRAADVFNMVSLCLGELHTIKVGLDMKYNITPAAEFNREKTASDVTQLLGYLANKLQLVMAALK